MSKPTMRSYLAAAGDFRRGKDDPRKFLERCLETIEAMEPHVGAFVTLNIDGARASADRATARWKAGKPLSPIDGMPIGIKDIIETADMPTQFGSPLFEGWHSYKDAASVAALRAAGAVILGKTVTTEFAMAHPLGDTRNPWDDKRTPGGSSSGSAAAAGAGMISAGLGTQVLASVLRPASYCGAYGYKPTVHGITRTGSHDPLSQSCTGIIAASLADTWQVAYEIVLRAGGDPGWPGLAGPDALPAATKPRRLAALETSGWVSATDGARRAFDAAAEKLKAAGVALFTRHDHVMVDALEPDIADAMELSLKISDWEMRWFMRTLADRDIDRLSSWVRERLTMAEQMTLTEYRDAMATRDEIRKSYEELSGDFDACITLAASDAAPMGLASTGNPAFGVPASLLGTPALSLPVLQAEGLPLGLQVIALPTTMQIRLRWAGGLKRRCAQMGSALGAI